MHELIERIENAVGQIKGLEEKREKLALFLREAREKVFFSGDVLERDMIHIVGKTDLEGKIVAGVDGGLSQHAYHGVDLILTRAVAAIFRYGPRISVDYFPSSIPAPKLIVLSDPYSDDDFVVSSSLERQGGEIEVALKVAEKIKPDVILMDGSIVPHGSDKPSKNSPAWERYQKVFENFRKLYSVEPLVAGCVEDSRGRRFCEIISEQVLSRVDDPKTEELKKVLEGTRDTNLLFHLLKTGERSFIFRYSKDSENHPVLSDLWEWGDKIYSFYIKTAEFDRPVRVDFVSSSPEKDANKIAEIVLATACHSSYGIPAPIIEADLRAKLEEKDVLDVHGQLVDKLGIVPSLMKLRRDQRPF
jgi:hypothetical protein